MVETDRRRIAADDYFTGLFETALRPDEVIVAVHFPIPQRSAYAKFSSHASKYALVGVMVAQTAGGVRVAVTGAGPTPSASRRWSRPSAQDFSASAIAALGSRIPVCAPTT